MILHCTLLIIVAFNLAYIGSFIITWLYFIVTLSNYNGWVCRSTITLGEAKTDFDAAGVTVSGLHPPYRVVGGSVVPQVDGQVRLSAQLSLPVI